MPRFTSPLQRRLWTWATLILLAIYTTLGSAGTIAAFLRVRGLLNLALGAAILALVVVISYGWVRQRPGLAEVLIALGVLAAYLWTAFRIIAAREERTHLIEYSLVAVLIFRALQERRRNGKDIPRPAALAFGVTALLGWMDEGIQFLLPNRIYDWRDVLFNLLAPGWLLVQCWRFPGRTAGRKSVPAKPRL
jgi:VanZ family protein